MDKEKQFLEILERAGYSPTLLKKEGDKYEFMTTVGSVLITVLSGDKVKIDISGLFVGMIDFTVSPFNRDVEVHSMHVVVAGTAETAELFMKRVLDQCVEELKNKV